MSRLCIKFLVEKFCIEQTGQSIRGRSQANSTRVPHRYSGRSVLCTRTGEDFIYYIIDCGENIKFCFIKFCFIIYFR